MIPRREPLAGDSCKSSAIDLMNFLASTKFLEPTLPDASTITPTSKAFLQGGGLGVSENSWKNKLTTFRLPKT